MNNKSYGIKSIYDLFDEEELIDWEDYKNRIGFFSFRQ